MEQTQPISRHDWPSRHLILATELFVSVHDLQRNVKESPAVAPTGDGVSRVRSLPLKN